MGDYREKRIKQLLEAKEKSWQPQKSSRKDCAPRGWKSNEGRRSRNITQKLPTSLRNNL
jgi:hypothetical protein